MGENRVKNYRLRLENASSYGEIWEVVKDTVASALNQRRAGMMLFLNDLPIQLGAYHPHWNKQHHFEPHPCQGC